MATKHGPPARMTAAVPPQASPSAKKPRNPKRRAKGDKAPAAPPVPRVDQDALRKRGLVAIAEVARPHGLAGELRLKVYNLDSDLLSRRPTVQLMMPDGVEREASILAARDVDKALLVRISGVEDRNAADAVRGAAICVPRASLPAPEEGEFYAWDVEGARAVLPSGETIGRVTELATYPTCEVLVVAREGKGNLEIPMVAAYVKSVDVATGVVELVTVDGLE